MRNRSLRWLVPLLIGACGVAGYAAGGGWDSVGKQEAAAKIAVLEQTRTVSRARRVEMDEFGGFEGLLSGRGKETDIWKVVSRLPVTAIPDALKELRAAQAMAASQGSETRRLDEIESALYFHWAEMDPLAALADVAAIPKSFELWAQVRKSKLVTSVLAAWMRTDANTAYQTVKDDKDFGYIGRDMLVQTWTPGTVFENLAKYPDSYADLLGWYCIAAVKSPFRRHAMLTALREQPEMKDRDRAYFMLFREWAYRDFPAAMAEAKKHDRPRLQNHVFEDGLVGQPATAIHWAVSQNIPPEGPRWEESYKNWLRFDATGAQQWLDEQAPAWTSTGHTAAVAGFRAEQLNTDGMRTESINIEAAGQKLTDLMNEWKSRDPEAAAKWLETAPEAARRLIVGKGAGDHE